MKRALPPLGTLVAFEAAARHLSFTRAGGELAVTQAAISHHVKALEEHLGRALFRRLPRALLLTDEGQALARAVGDALARLATATAQARAEAAPPRLVVTVLPSFAARWLVPRLGRFYDAHPALELHIVATKTVVDLEREGVDVGIRYGKGQWRGVVAEHLLDEELIPVCSPALRAGTRPLKRPADLASHTLLVGDHEEDWRDWLVRAGAAEVPVRGPRFTDSNLLVQAAVAGQGVALGRGVLVHDELAAGRLVRALPRLERRWPAEHAYYIVSPPSRARRPEVRAFADWLRAEARAYRRAVAAVDSTRPKYRRGRIGEGADSRRSSPPTSRPAKD